MAELKPCPFCGSAPKESGNNLVSITIECSNADCKASPFVNERNKAEAYKAWNARPDDAVRTPEQREKEIAELEEEIICIGGLILDAQADKAVRSEAALRRTLARLQAIRAELQKGMKG